MAKKQVKDGNVISFSPDTFTTGGLFDDEDAVVTEAQFEIWDYGGKADREATALRLKLEQRDGTEMEQYWSVGDPDVYWPDDGGKKVISTKTALNSSSNFAIFLSTLVGASGFPLNLIEEDIGGLVGLDAHWMRVAPPKKRSIKKATDDEGRERKDLVLVVSKINALPGEGGKKGKGKGGAKGKQPAAKPEAGGGDLGHLEDASVAAVQQALADNNNTLPRVQLAKMAMPHLPDDWSQPDKSTAIKDLIFDEEWLGAHPWAWTYEKGIVTAV